MLSSSSRRRQALQAVSDSRKRSLKRGVTELCDSVRRRSWMSCGKAREITDTDTPTRSECAHHRHGVELLEGLHGAEEEHDDAAALHRLHGTRQQVRRERFKVLQDLGGKRRWHRFKHMQLAHGSLRQMHTSNSLCRSAQARGQARGCVFLKRWRHLDGRGKVRTCRTHMPNVLPRILWDSCIPV